jgi:hypothetical protein
VAEVEADQVGAEADVDRQRPQAAQALEQAVLRVPGQGHDHLVDRVPTREVEQLVDAAEHREAADVVRHPSPAVVEEADEADAAAVGGVPEPLDQPLPVLGGADDDDVPGEAAFPLQPAQEAVQGQA